MKADLTRYTFHAGNHYRDVVKHQGSVDIDADRNEQQAINVYRAETTTTDVIGPCGVPLHEAGFAISTDGITLKIGAGRIYVDGILCENEEDDLDYLKQPDAPGLRSPIETLREAHTTVGIVYLDVWLRHLTPLDDPLMREVALGGPFSSTRTKVVWQVKVLPVASRDAQCGSDLAEWKELITPSNGKLNARTRRTPFTENPCLLPPHAAYQRLENQLYRVEIHQGSDAATATLKFSRDNGSIVTAIESVSGNDIVVQDVGPDEVLGFSAGQWVEISDDLRELKGEPGELIQIDTVNETSRTLTMKTTPPAVDRALHPKLRRWDQTGVSATPNGVKILGDWQHLEDGVEVLLEGTHKPGDYWLIPARTITGEIEWPPFEVPNSNPVAQSPLGITHHFCRLALVRFAREQLTVFEDCRKLFPPLTEVTTGAEPGIRVTELRLETGEPLLNDSDVPVDRFATGLHIICDDNVDKRSIRDRPVCFVTLELPFPFNAADRQIWGDEVVGFQSVTLAAELGVDGTRILWTPTGATRGWLQEKLLQRMREFRLEASVLARLTLQGNFIWNEANPELFLDGEVFGVSDSAAGNTRLRLPSGDRRRGGKLEMWFRLVLPSPPQPVLIEFALRPERVRGPAEFFGIVTLDREAPPGGVVIDLFSRVLEGPAVEVSLAPSVPVQSGARSAEFSGRVAVTRADARIEITASFNGINIGRPLDVIGVPG